MLFTCIGYICCLIASFVALFYFVELLLYMLLKEKEGVLRKYSIAEYKRNRRHFIKLDASYVFWNAIKNTEMESKRRVRFEIDANGYIVPSQVYSDPDAKIFFLGDSTIENPLVDPENRYPYLIGVMLSQKYNKKINSYNAGYSGMDNYDLINVLITKVLPETPDLLIIQNTISEVVSVCSNKQLPLRELDSLHESLKDKGKKIIQRMYPRIYCLLVAQKANKKKNHISRSIQPINERTVLKKIKLRYEIIADICKSEGIPLILCTQKNAYEDKNDKRLRELFYCNINVSCDFVVFVSLLKKANEVIREVARQKEIPIFDLEYLMPYQQEYIYDQVHYTDKGSKLVANLFCTEMKECCDTIFLTK